MVFLYSYAACVHIVPDTDQVETFTLIHVPVPEKCLYVHFLVYKTSTCLTDVSTGRCLIFSISSVLRAVASSWARCAPDLALLHARVGWT